MRHRALRQEGQDAFTWPTPRGAANLPIRLVERGRGFACSYGMNQDERTDDATAVAFAVFDLFRVVGDETVYDVSRAIEPIREYGERRARESWRRPRRAKVVPLRMVGL